MITFTAWTTDIPVRPGRYPASCEANSSQHAFFELGRWSMPFADDAPADVVALARVTPMPVALRPHVQWRGITEDSYCALLAECPSLLD